MVGITYRISTSSSVTTTRSINSSTNSLFCSKVAWSNPCSTRRQNSAIVPANSAISICRSTCAMTCCSWLTSDPILCSISPRRRWYSSSTITPLKYASVNRSTWCFKLACPLRKVASRDCNCCGSQLPACARSKARAVISGCLTTSHRSAHTNSSSCWTGINHDSHLSSRAE